MSDCSCGARGIDLDGHECVAWLKLRLIERSEQLAALGPWTVQTLRQYVADTSDGFECLPNCDSFGHEELCPVTNTVQAFRLLRERLADQDTVREAYCETLRAEYAEKYRQLREEFERQLVQRDERVRELEQRLDSYICRAEQDLEPKLKAAQERGKIAIRKYESAETEAIRLSDKVRTLEQQLKAAQERLNVYLDFFRLLDIRATDEDLQAAVDRRVAQLAELKSTKERLAEAEGLVEQGNQVVALTMKAIPVEGTIVAFKEERAKFLRLYQEYFAKHSPWKCGRCGAIPERGHKHSPECEAGV